MCTKSSHMCVPLARTLLDFINTYMQEKINFLRTNEILLLQYPQVSYQMEESENR